MLLGSGGNLLDTRLRAAAASGRGVDANACDDDDRSPLFVAVASDGAERVAACCRCSNRLSPTPTAPTARMSCATVQFKNLCQTVSCACLLGRGHRVAAHCWRSYRQQTQRCMCSAVSPRVRPRQSFCLSPYRGKKNFSVEVDSKTPFGAACKKYDYLRAMTSPPPLPLLDVLSAIHC
jgi:hypothetical protein